MKVVTTKVYIMVSDDGGKCDEDCPFLVRRIPRESIAISSCDAFDVEIENMERCIPCVAREDVTCDTPRG